MPESRYARAAPGVCIVFATGGREVYAQPLTRCNSWRGVRLMPPTLPADLMLRSDAGICVCYADRLSSTSVQFRHGHRQGVWLPVAVSYWSHVSSHRFYNPRFASWLLSVGQWVMCWSQGVRHRPSDRVWRHDHRSYDCASVNVREQCLPGAKCGNGPLHR